MKIVLNKKAFTINPDRFLRRAGYAYIRDRNTGKVSYARHFGRGRYPRLHMYYEEIADRISFSLHLDQKHASYSGSHMHNAEYDGELVEAEINRLKGILRTEKSNPGSLKDGDDSSGNKNPLQEMGQGKIINTTEKKPWWKSIF